MFLNSSRRVFSRYHFFIIFIILQLKILLEILGACDIRGRKSQFLIPNSIHLILKRPITYSEKTHFNRKMQPLSATTLPLYHQTTVVVALKAKAGRKTRISSENSAEVVRGSHKQWETLPGFPFLFIFDFSFPFPIACAKMWFQRDLRFPTKPNAPRFHAIATQLLTYCCRINFSYEGLVDITILIYICSSREFNLIFEVFHKCNWSDLSSFDAEIE
jgi:hypothetical protein